MTAVWKINKMTDAKRTFTIFFITGIRSHVQNNNFNFKTGDQFKQSRQSIAVQKPN